MRSSAILVLIFGILEAVPWPIAPQDRGHPIGNNYGEYQYYNRSKSPHRKPYLHSGIDIVDTAGAPVLSVSKGYVKAWLTTDSLHPYFYWRVAVADSPGPGLSDGWLYAHIDPDMPHVDVGDTVERGDTIGYLVPFPYGPPPLPRFDHLHFSRIRCEGEVWDKPDWDFIENPLLLIEPNTDTSPPQFEIAGANCNLFMFCKNETNEYLSPDSLYGPVDIIVKAYDKYGLPLRDRVWERIGVYKISYYIHGKRSIPEKLSFIFKGELPSPEPVDVIYKSDSVCQTSGDWWERDYYYIITNSDGDSVVELSDKQCAWHTESLPDGHYWVVVKLEDEKGNIAKDSMLVTLRNGIGITEEISKSVKIDIFPNPIIGNGSISVEEDFPAIPQLEIFDSNGRKIRSIKGKREDKRIVYPFDGEDKKGKRLTTGVYFLILRNNGRFYTEKIILLTQSLSL